MRKIEKQITNFKEIEKVLRTGSICHLAMLDGKLPYIVPLNYGYKNMILYFHSSHKGKKINLIKNNPNVCFEIETETRLVTEKVPCNWGMTFISVIGYGKVSFIDDLQEKQKALNILMRQYNKKSRNTFTAEAMAMASVFAVNIDSITGKKSGF